MVLLISKKHWQVSFLVNEALSFDSLVVRFILVFKSPIDFPLESLIIQKILGLKEATAKKKENKKAKRKERLALEHFMTTKRTHETIYQSTAPSFSESRVSLGSISSSGAKTKRSQLKTQNAQNRAEDKEFIEKHQKNMRRLFEFQIGSKEKQKIHFELHRAYLRSIIADQ